jgi:hypothetical protein
VTVGLLITKYNSEFIHIIHRNLSHFVGLQRKLVADSAILQVDGK